MYAKCFQWATEKMLKPNLVLNQKQVPSVVADSHSMPSKKLSNLFFIMIFIVSYLW